MCVIDIPHCFVFASQIPSGPPALNRTIHGAFGVPSGGGSGTSNYLSTQIGDVSPRGVNAPVQQQRRKVMDEGKLKKVFYAIQFSMAFQKRL